MRTYESPNSPFGLLSETDIKKLCPDHPRLYEHAFVFACLDGNAFGRPGPDQPMINQYLPEAYANLWSNGALDDIPNIYPCTAIEALYASITEEDERWAYYQTHEDFVSMGEEKRSHIRSLFK